MKNLLRNPLLVGCLVSSSFLIPMKLSAASGCSTGQLQGVYNAQITTAGFQGVVTLPPTTTTGTIVGFGSNPNSLTGSLPGLGRYYFDGTGNIIGITAATSTSPTVNTNVGTYSVNADCSGSVKLTSGANYDLFVAVGGNQGIVNSQTLSGTQALFVRTDATGGGEAGTLRNGGSCVNLNYPGTFIFQVGGGSKQTPASGTQAFYPYSVAGNLTLDGSGNFSIAETLSNGSGIARYTATGTYTVGADCSVTLKFSTTTGANSTNFVAPTSFRFLMVDPTTGLLAVQPDANTTITGVLIAQ
jgi:hypothetical protein